MIRTSDSIAKIAPALVAAQAMMTNAPKETKGQVGSQVRYYTDLATLTDLVRPILAENALAYLQFPSGGGNGTVTLTTRLVHASGEWLEDDVTMPAGQNGAQGVGSALTYARRYSLMAVLGIGSDDDDGAAASQAPQKQRQAPKPPVSTGPSEAVTKRAMAMFKEAGIDDRNDRLSFTSYVTKRAVESWGTVTAKEADAVIGVLDNVIKGKATLGFEDDGTLAVKVA